MKKINIKMSFVMCSYSLNRIFLPEDLFIVILYFISDSDFLLFLGNFLLV